MGQDDTMSSANNRGTDNNTNAQNALADDSADDSAKPNGKQQAAEPTVFNYNPQDYTDDRGTTSGQTLPVQNSPIKGNDTKLAA